MLDTTDDIAEGISFQAFEDDCRLLASLLHDVLLRELGPRFIQTLERNRILAQVLRISSCHRIDLIIHPGSSVRVLTDR